jgi:hypothetical protein
VARLRGDGDGRLALPAPEFVAAAWVEGPVRETTGGSRVRFLLRQAGEDVEGDGFTFRVSPQGRYEGRLPPDEYAVLLEQPSGAWRRPGTVSLDRPGARVHLPLRPD